MARLTVTHPLIAGTGFLWAPVVIAMADALCAFGVSHHWPEGARSFTTVDCSANFISSAREGEQVDGDGGAAASRPDDAGLGRHRDERDDRAADGVVSLHPADPVLRRRQLALPGAAVARRRSTSDSSAARSARPAFEVGLVRPARRGGGAPATRPGRSVAGWSARMNSRRMRTKRAGSVWCGKCPASSKISNSLPGHGGVDQAAVAERDDGVAAAPDDQRRDALGQVGPVQHGDDLALPVDARAQRAQDGAAGLRVGQRVEDGQDLLGVASERGVEEAQQRGAEAAGEPDRAAARGAASGPRRPARRPRGAAG